MTAARAGWLITLTPAVLFPFLLLVFHRGHLRVFALAAGLISRTGFLQMRLASAFRIDRERREQLLHIRACARRAGRSRRAAQDQQFEFFGAMRAAILVNRHLSAGILTG